MNPTCVKVGPQFHKFVKTLDGQFVQIAKSPPTVYLQLQPRGSIFQNGFLGEVLFKGLQNPFYLPCET